MTSPQKIEQLFEQLSYYAEQSQLTQAQAQQRIAELEGENSALHQRVSELEERLQLLRSKLTQHLQQGQPQTWLARPEALMAMIRDTLGLNEPAPEPSQAPQQNLDALSPQQRLAYWEKRYPRAFMPGAPQPLKIGIHEELLAAEGGELKRIHRALAHYVKVPRYLRSIQAGAVRLDLEGNNAGFVTAQEASFAQQQLHQLEQQKKEKRQQARLDQKLKQLVQR